MMTVSFVLATFNRGAVAVDCIRRTLACADAVLGRGIGGSVRYTVVVVDNASTDDTADRINTLAGERPEVRLIRLAENQGPVAKNAGIRNNIADILVLLDDDAYPLPGSIARMIKHFEEDPRLGAAVFDVTLPDGSREASAYPDVFIGAGTALRRKALDMSREVLPADFFMQAEEYDLSFRLVAYGWSVQRFWDMPLVHLKSPGARIGQRTTGLDVRNNLFVLARYVGEPLCRELGADWLARYWWMAVARDKAAGSAADPSHGTHRESFMRGAAQGLAEWEKQRAVATLLPPDAEERIFKMKGIRDRMARVVDQHGLRRVAFGDLGKNTWAYHQAARALNLEIVAVVDDELGAAEGELPRAYRGIPLIRRAEFDANHADALILTALSPVHAERRAGAWRRVFSAEGSGRANGPLPVLDIFSRRPMSALVSRRTEARAPVVVR